MGVHELIHPNESIYDHLRRQWAAQFGNVIKAIHSQFLQVTLYILKAKAAVIQLCTWVGLSMRQLPNLGFQTG